jgi:hypothetical protein
MNNKQVRPTAVFIFFLAFVLLGCGHRSGNNAKAIDSLSTEIPKTANPPVDKSAMDISYFPTDFPVKKMGGVEKGLPVMRVVYSRPALDGRVMFGNIVKYGKPWRLGANEATEIEFFRNVNIMGKNIPAGRYVLYCVPFQDKWTIKLNTDLYTWGLKIDSKNDLYEFEVPVQPLGFTMEFLSMQFIPSNNGAALRISWERNKVELPIKI